MVEMMGVEPISETLHFGFTPRRNHSIPILVGVLLLASQLLPAPSALVLRLGLEPRSRRLRVACNTIILTKHIGAAGGIRTPKTLVLSQPSLPV